YAAAGKQLQAAKLVAASPDGDGFVQGINAHHLELTQHGKTIKRDRSADARDHRVEILKPSLAVIKHRPARGDIDGDAQRGLHLDVMSAGARRLADAPMAIEMRIARKQRDLHGPYRPSGGLGFRAAPSMAQAPSLGAADASAAADGPQGRNAQVRSGRGPQ